MNSTFIACLTTILCLLFAVCGAYTLSTLRWRGRAGFAFLLLLDVAFVLPIAIWILKNVFDSIPREIIDAALVDGCGPFRVLGQIILPLSVPGLVAVGVVAFFFAWNEFLFASTLVTRDAIRPASVGLSTLTSMLDTPIERLLAAGLIFALPPVIFYLIVQRYVVAGLTAGAVKG